MNEKMNTMGLRAKIRNLSNETGVNPQVLMQNYMLERFLERISVSAYKDNFILKGGLLVASLVGIGNRNTMDMDSSIKGVDFNEQSILKMYEDIASIDLGDEITFELKKIVPIRDEDEYGGYRMNVSAKYYTLVSPLRFDFSAGDTITPKQISTKYKMMLDDREITIPTYNIETILAEKLQTVFSRDIANTRLRDYYDLYILPKLKSDDINVETLILACENTLKNRDSEKLFYGWEEKLVTYQSNSALNALWDAFVVKNTYVGDLSFCDTLESISKLMTKISR
jgi:predicted nucleotidyltransferase component of viral defense system